MLADGADLGRLADVCGGLVFVFRGVNRWLGPNDALGRDLKGHYAGIKTY